jgi:hypothetical protein
MFCLWRQGLRLGSCKIFRLVRGVRLRCDHVQWMMLQTKVYLFWSQQSLKWLHRCKVGLVIVETVAFSAVFGFLALASIAVLLSLSLCFSCVFAFHGFVLCLVAFLCCGIRRLWRFVQGWRLEFSSVSLPTRNRHTREKKNFNSRYLGFSVAPMPKSWG